MEPDHCLDVLLVQYRECLSLIGMRIATMWQLPSVTMATNTFLGITYLGYAETHEAKLVILLASFFFTLVSTIELRKHRFKLDALYIDFRSVEEKLCQLMKDKIRDTCPIRKIKLKTKDIVDDVKGYPPKDLGRNWWVHRKATHWFLGSLYLTMFVIIVVFLIEFAGFLTTNR